MKCPHCAEDYNQVINSRNTKNDTQVWRRRECLVCGEIFSTYERVTLSYIVVVKRDGKRERFSYEKLFAGIFTSAISRKNIDKGDTAVFVKKIAEFVQEDILLLKKKIITSNEIRNIVLNILEKRDLETYLFYLAYVKKFTSKKVLLDELER